jgi:hypothetical protein
MEMKAMQRTVTVWGKPHPVAISQAGRTSFMAAGDYQGQKLFARGQSAHAALAAWAAAAKSQAR